MKKMIAMMLAAVMMLSCMAGVAFAAEPGETVTVEFYVVGNPGFASFGAYINYDHAALKLVDVQPGEKCAGAFMANTANDKVGYFNATDITGDGLMFVATFEINANAAAGTYPVTVAVDAPENAAGESINLVIAGGNVVVDEVEAPECEHEWGEWEVTTPATCETAGVETRTCTKCGETETREIAALGHNWGEWEVTTEATCEEPGVETRTCANCGETETREIPALGHDWGEVPTYGYDEEGHWLICSCGHKGEKEAHAFENNGYCKCGYLDPNYNPGGGNDDDEPQTGDITPVIVLGVFGVMAMAATVVVSNKRKNVK